MLFKYIQNVENSLISGEAKSQILFSNSPAIDAFGRLRVSNPVTLFDSKQIFKDSSLNNDVENFPLLYDNQETSGSGTSTLFNLNTASTKISVSTNTVGTRVRQTYMRFNYQPGKSILHMQTFTFSEPRVGIRLRKGIFDEKNGLFLENNELVYNFVQRSYTSNATIDTKVERKDWNIDPLDGTGISSINIDFTKTQILVIDYEWLGVGRVRFGFVINGTIIYAHYFRNANALSDVYMSLPNLPLRSEVTNLGNGGVGFVKDICATVISEGGTNDLGVLRYTSTNASSVNIGAPGNVYAILGIRLKSSHIGMSVKLIECSIMTETNDDFEWLLLFNPTISGTFTYSDETLSAVQFAKGDGTNIATNGYKIAGGVASKSLRSITATLNNAILLGSAIDDTRDIMVLCINPITSSPHINAGITWREIS